MKTYQIPRAFADFRIRGIEIPDRPEVEALYDIQAKEIRINFCASDAANVTYVRFTNQYVPPCKTRGWNWRQ